MDIIFRIVSNALNFIAAQNGLTYPEVNILIYFFIIPFTYLILLDIYIRKHYLKILWILFSVIFFVSVRFNEFSNWLFKKSQDFLKWFNIIGLNYITSSVIICVIVVLAIYLFLFWIIHHKRKNKMKRS